ncbi:MAG: TIGR04211 family SH3 domain-containing protein [Methylococcaceae bacterium]
MKYILGLIFISLSLNGLAQAQTIYVIDNLDLPLRSEENTKSKIIKMLPAATPLTVVSQNSETGFSLVQLNDGTEGYILTRHTLKDAPKRLQLETSNQKVQILQAENATLKAEIESLKETLTPGTTLEKSLAQERDELSRELNEIKQASANVIQLKNQRDELQERVVNAERDLQQLKLENQALSDSSSQDWFLYGGILALTGVILGFILPKLGWRRKSAWDTY